MSVKVWSSAAAPGTPAAVTDTGRVSPLTLWERPALGHWELTQGHTRHGTGKWEAGSRQGGGVRAEENLGILSSFGVLWIAWGVLEHLPHTAFGPLHSRIWRGRPLLMFSLWGRVPSVPRFRHPWQCNVT